MYIKNIYNVNNYKGLPDNFKIDLDDINYIVGDNAKSKTTVGSIPLWVITGYSLTGNNRESVARDSTKTTTASITIVDNDNCLHTITRIKGRKSSILLDDIQVDQAIMARFYKDIHAFICAYSPTYFRSLQQVEQRNLLLRILPVVSSQDAFELLDNDEKKILEKPVVDLKGFTEITRAEVKKIKSDIDRLTGEKESYIKIAIQKEGELIIFQKEKELETLEKEYEQLIANTENIIDIEEIKVDINKLNDRISKNIKKDFEELKLKYENELNKLESVSDTKSTCPTCKQQIKNESLINALSISCKRDIKKIKEQTDNLKKETQELIKKRDNQLKRYNELQNPEIQQKEYQKKELKVKIDKLREEQKNIELHNKEVSIKNKLIIDAKKNIEQLSNSIEEKEKKIELYNKQIKIVQKLHLLINEKQMRQVKQYLNHVNIEFSKVDKETGEIINVYVIKYDGKEYEKLSKSFKLRADIEISLLINKITGINTPTFLDDIESITNIPAEIQFQTLLAIVIKYNELEILHSFSDVLQRQKISIMKQIETNNNIMQIAA